MKRHWDNDPREQGVQLEIDFEPLRSVEQCLKDMNRQVGTPHSMRFLPETKKELDKFIADGTLRMEENTDENTAKGYLHSANITSFPDYVLVYVR